MKRHSIKALGLAMMAGVAGMVGSSTVSQIGNRDIQHTVKRDHSNKNQTPETQRISQETKSMKINNEVNRGLGNGYGRNYGIPPKTYGMHFVKRGTRKSEYRDLTLEPHLDGWVRHSDFA